MKYITAVLLVLLFSCAKEKSCENCIPKNNYISALIVYSGPLETDGCGWLVKVDSATYFHPEYLDPVFQQNDLPVQIMYNKTNNVYRCGIAGIGFPVVEILKISRQ